MFSEKSRARPHRAWGNIELLVNGEKKKQWKSGSIMATWPLVFPVQREIEVGKQPVGQRVVTF